MSDETARIRDAQMASIDEYDRRMNEAAIRGHDAGAFWVYCIAVGATFAVFLTAILR